MMAIIAEGADIPATNPSRSRETNALSRLRCAPTRQGTTRSTQKNPKCLALADRRNKRLLKVSTKSSPKISRENCSQIRPVQSLKLN
jgi:hypothetical protein